MVAIMFNMRAQFGFFWGSAEGAAIASSSPDESPKEELTPTTKLDEKTKQLTHTPHSYTLIDDLDKKSGSSAEKLCFYVVGCGGNGSTMQKEVAELMNKAAQSGEKPKFIIILGDNFYDNGTDSPIDPAFTTNFYDVYHDKKLSTLAGTPCFIIPGNHDHNIHRGIYGTRNGDIDFQKIASQIKHTYIDKDGAFIPERERLFNEKILSLSQLPKWNMPRRYYSFDIEKKAIEFFMLDSSTYVKDYLTSLTHDRHNPHNQAIWLEHTAKQNKRAIKLVFLHHPLNTIGKRVFHPDQMLYLSASDLAELQTLKITGNYNQFLSQILQRQGLVFDAAFSAHDHSMYYYLELSKENPLCQIVAGGGGGKLDSRSAVPYSESVPCFFKNHGFVSVRINPHALTDKLIFDFYTINQHHLQFSHLSTQPRKLALDDEAVAELRQLLLETCRMYLKTHLGSSGNLSGFFKNIYEHRRAAPHGGSGIYRADNLMNFLNRYENLTIKQIILYLTESMGYWTTPSPESLITMIATRIQKKYDMPYDDFISQYEWVMLTPPHRAPAHAGEFKAIAPPPRRKSDSFLLASPRHTESMKEREAFADSDTSSSTAKPSKSMNA